MTEPNLTRVQAMYAAFARGDVAAITSACSEDTVWEVVGPPGAYPTFGKWTSRRSVAEFFAALASASEIKEFTVGAMYACGDKVFVEGHEVGVIKATGRTTDSDWLHVFTFKDGLVSGFREFYDTAQFV